MKLFSLKVKLFLLKVKLFWVIMSLTSEETQECIKISNRARELCGK